ncbi:hypothetical protein MHIB_22400 [Mycolicibacter hiberniae]|uniref:Uncharacterized protein n=1 Tax=Mycolicibacter hiberniae TaxID=29314 RepID=A0A7I7X2X2_9MYCO|nr:hypothetical protein MHIB_22400 [Mycolicibacter hiberniae]
MLATPTTFARVLKSTDRLPTDSATVLCAGQYRSGIHCTSVSSTQSKLPVIGGLERTAMLRSAALRSLTGAENVTTTGCATPTTAPDAGWIEAIPVTGGCVAAAELSPGVTSVVTATPITTIADRTDVHIVGIPSPSSDLGYRR